MKTLLTAALLGAATALVPMARAASTVQFSADTYDIDEVALDGSGTREGVVLHISLERTAPFDFDASVGVVVDGGTAVEGADFKVPAKRLQSPGATWGPWIDQIALTAFDDGLPEGDETVVLRLVDPTNGLQLGPRSTATVTIRNGKPTVIVARDFVYGDSYPVFIPEGPNAQIEVSRKGDRHEAASVDVEFLAGGDFPDGVPAVAGTDFAPGIHRIEFAPGEVSRWLPAPWQDNPRVDALHKVLAVRLTSHTPGVAVNPAEPLTLVLVDNERATHLDVAYVELLPPFALFSRVEGGEEFFVQPAIISLPDDRKLAVGASWGMFNRVNGVPRPGLVRLLTNDDVDESFVPDVVGVASRVKLLRSGYLILFDSGRDQIIRLKLDGSRDETFRMSPGLNYESWVEDEDGSFWLATGDEAPLLHLAADGTKIGEFETVIPPRCEECQPWRPFGLLSNGRLIFRTSGAGRDFVQVFHPDGRPDTSVPSLTVEHANNGGGLAGANVVLFKVTKRFPSVRFLNLPNTALQITTKPTPPWRSSSEFNEIESTPDGLKFINVVFQRLGTSAASATVYYTTRDVTARAGKDYIAQSGTLTFAPLETEKAIQIPILADTEDEFDETLEVVVTAAEGFEALPAPMRLTILGKGPAPRLDRVKRLRDGRVLLGGTGPQDTTRLEYSPDLQTWHPLIDLLGGFNGESAVWLDASATNAATRYYRAVAR